MNEVSNASFWQDIYIAGDTRWDLGSPTPAFVALQQARSFAPGRMLVPGCGRGYDAVFFAQQGFDVTAVDFADQAVIDVRANADRAGVALNILQEDVFALGKNFSNTFDYVLEYTCYCAIAPERREEYATMIRDVLKPGGLLIGIFFPLDGRPDGPPFATSVEEITRFFSPAFDLELSETPELSVTPRRDKEQLMLWRRHA